MPPDFGSAFSIDIARRPPHMSIVDFVLWQRFRRQNTLPFLRLFFDVAVGPGADPGMEAAPVVRSAWERITRQRIDVVGDGINGWTIIEIRGAAGPGAIGSIGVYRDLWNDDPPDERPISLWLVTDIFPDSLRRSLELIGAELFLV